MCVISTAIPPEKLFTFSLSVRDLELRQCLLSRAVTLWNWLSSVLTEGSEEFTFKNILKNIYTFRIFAEIKTIY